MRALLFLITLSFSSVVQAAPVPAFCDLKMRGKPIQLDARIDEVFDFVRSLDPELISFERIPTWKDFDEIEKNLEKLKALKKDLTERGELEQVTFMAKEVATEVKDDAKIKAILTQAKASPPPSTYLPTQYELSRLYEKLLYSFNKELPSELRLPIKRLPYDQRHDQLLTQAYSLLKNQELRFNAQFSNTGFKSLVQYKNAINQFKETKNLYKLIDEEKVEFAMNRPENARWWVHRVGFQNQRTSGTSGGTMDPDFRDHIEAALTGNNYSTYSKFDNELKPQYGYLKPVGSSTLKQSESASSYGDDTYIFKKSRVRDRLTWTSGDSFGTADFLEDVHNETALPKAWKGYFIPWADRDLMVVDLLPKYKEGTGFSADYESPDFSADPEFLKLTQPVQPTYPVPPPEAPLPPIGPIAPPYPEYPAKAKDPEAEWKRLADVYTKSAEYLKYEKDLEAFDTSEAYLKYLSDFDLYIKSDAYHAYTVETDKYTKTPEYLKYMEDSEKYSAEVAKITERLAAQKFKGTPLENFTRLRANGYIELQYFGPVTLDDVEIFEFKKTPPSGEFLNELKKRGILIRDGRKTPATLWNGKN